MVDLFVFGLGMVCGAAMMYPILRRWRRNLTAQIRDVEANIEEAEKLLEREEARWN